MDGPLDAMLPPVRRWFRRRYGSPTQPQTQGWPPIQRGEHTLILAPTGSGKTLAAFLWGINRIFEQLLADSKLPGVRLLYVSPLKALNNDIARNLVEPLAGIREAATELGIALPELRTAVRTGDTSAAERQRMLRNPPHILITTPESLYLILTSPAARDMLGHVECVIVDEIHTLCGNKRGVHMALSLERLVALTGRPVQRIGLSATQRPLDEVARYLGGQEWQRNAAGERALEPRPVAIVDAGVRKPLDLRIVTAVPDLRRLPGGSIWPALIPQVLAEIRQHDTTLVFTNSRRAAERAADRLNEQFALEDAEEIAPGSVEGLLVDGAPKGQGMMGTGRVGGPFRAHHGSVSREVRFELEQELKEGDLAALIATSSLELGIDIGSVQAVLQLQSPRSIARGLQRVGRSGHLVGQTSYGRIYATHREDLLDAAAVAHGMLAGDIEPTYTPHNCLDILAQQVVAMVAVEVREVEATYDLVRQAAGYDRLSREAFRAVLKMISGGYATDAYKGLRPCIEWDRINDRLLPLPGSRLLAIRNGGAIPDLGEFRVTLPDGRTNLGNLDEEFVFETRVGDVFTLGSNTWRVMDIDEDRMVVADAAGATPRMPFWRGDAPKRDYHTGLRLGAFRRELAERAAALPWAPEDPTAQWPPEAEPLFRWLAQDYAMDDSSARNALVYVHRQLDAIGAISTDRAIVVERFADALGDQRLVIHSCFGARINSVWAIALTHALRERLGTTVEVQVNDDAILLRLVEGDREPPLDVICGMGADEARERVLQELPNSAVFGAQFRMNAARALILPRVRGAGRRTPFWLQRLRAKDLLAMAKGWDDFPLIAETYRDCLRDVLDVEHLSVVLEGIASGEIRVWDVESIAPSPLAAGLLLQFAGVYLYEDDAPKLERQIQALSLNRELLGELLEDGALPDLLRQEAVESVSAQLQRLADGYQARTADELATVLRELGDLTVDELEARSRGDARVWLLRLLAEGRAIPVRIPTVEGLVERYISAEDYGRYRDALGLSMEPPVALPSEVVQARLEPDAARLALLRRLLRNSGPLTRADILARYAFAQSWPDAALEQLVAEGRVVSGRLSPGGVETEWCDRQVLERLHRETLGLLRKEVRSVELPVYADFLLRWQGLHPLHRTDGDGMEQALDQLVGLALPAEVWERDLLPLRMAGYDPRQLDELCRRGELVWVAAGPDAQHMTLRLIWAGEGSACGLTEPDEAILDALSPDAQRIYAFVRAEGGAQAHQLERALGLARLSCERALAELTFTGLVTNESLEPLRMLLAGRFGAPDAGPIASSLDQSLAEWRAQRRPAALQRPMRAELTAGRRRVSERMSRPQRAEGRWVLVHRYGVLGEPLSPVERALEQARRQLQRYGILTRDMVDKEPDGLSWSALYPHLHRMELRGELRRGYFVQGLEGQQFALSQAVEQLRAWNHPDAEGRAALTLASAIDPAVVYGPTAMLERMEGLAATLPPEANPYRFDRIPSNYVVLQNGAPILLYEHGGARWCALPGIQEDLAREAVSLCLAHLTRPGGLAVRPTRVLVQTWNGRSPLEEPAQRLLAPLGFRREALSLVWDGLSGAPGATLASSDATPGGR